MTQTFFLDIAEALFLRTAGDGGPYKMLWYVSGIGASCEIIQRDVEIVRQLDSGGNGDVHIAPLIAAIGTVVDTSFLRYLCLEFALCGAADSQSLGKNF